MTEVTYATIIKTAKSVKTNVKKNYKTGVKSTWSYYFAKAIVSPKKNVKKITIKDAPNPNGTSISNQITKAKYVDISKRLIKYVEKNKVLPNYVSYGNYRLTPHLLTEIFSRILVYYNSNGKMPLYANANSKVFTKPSESKNDVFNYFVKKFGKVSTIDGALGKIAGNGYGYYYDDKYSNKVSIDRMKAGKGINCTDSSQVFWNIGKALGYNVRAVHVKCSGGDGHVRLQFKHSKHTGGKWINRDPASVLSNGNVTGIWCSSGTVLAYNPSWFTQNVSR